ncbi:hypothetical protein E3Q17_03217 [Wallemia mellicola]|uniref:Uncharacterized protein n=1 Tax=Wallemia mellicola TaxID=1708541 RepID=A0A4T0NL35_9BASI|nr:hypothetical protein E3Q17_03217 [Wallemia mellicola]
MGNAASKAPRRLSKTQTKEIPRTSESLNRMKAPPKEEILKDGQDPDFSANLSKIDPVKIHKMQTNFKPSDKMMDILKGRKIENDIENAAMTRNRLSAQSLLSYLEERKGSSDVTQLNKEFDVENQTMEAISEYLAAPRLGTPFTVKVDNERGEIERVEVFV